MIGSYLAWKFLQNVLIEKKFIIGYILLWLIGFTMLDLLENMKIYEWVIFSILSLTINFFLTMMES